MIFKDKIIFQRIAGETQKHRENGEVRVGIMIFELPKEKLAHQDLKSLCFFLLIMNIELLLNAFFIYFGFQFKSNLA